MVNFWGLLQYLTRPDLNKIAFEGTDTDDRRGYCKATFSKFFSELNKGQLARLILDHITIYDIGESYVRRIFKSCFNVDPGDRSLYDIVQCLKKLSTKKSNGSVRSDQLSVFLFGIEPNNSDISSISSDMGSLGNRIMENCDNMPEVTTYVTKKVDFQTGHACFLLRDFFES